MSNAPGASGGAPIPGPDGNRPCSIVISRKARDRNQKLVTMPPDMTRRQPALKFRRSP